MINLIEKIRKARESTLTVNGHTFTIRRPTDIEMTQGGFGLEAMLDRFVVGWDVREIDIVPGGMPEPVPFSSALFSEWIADRPEDWMEIANAIKQAYIDHTEKRSESVKN